jgi:hypothetical protein
VCVLYCRKREKKKKREKISPIATTVYLLDARPDALPRKSFLVLQGPLMPRAPERVFPERMRFCELLV